MTQYMMMMQIKVAFCAILVLVLDSLECQVHPESLQTQGVFSVVNAANDYARLVHSYALTNNFVAHHNDNIVYCFIEININSVLKHQKHTDCIFLNCERPEIPVWFFRRLPILKGFHGAFFNYSINFLRPPNPPSSQYHPLQELGSFDRFQLGFVVIQESCFCPLLEILGPLRNIQPFNLIGVLSLAF